MVFNLTESKLLRNIFEEFWSDITFFDQMLKF